MIGASISRWTMSYFAMALAWLFVALALMVAGLGFPSAHLVSPDTLVLVHVVCIGWLSVAMCGALFQFVPVLVAKPLFSEQWALPALTDGAIDPEAMTEARRGVAIAQHAAFAGSSYAEMIRANVADFWTRISTDVVLAAALATFGKFLLGVWAGRTEILVRASRENAGSDDASLAWMRRGAGWGLVIGVACEGIVVADAAFPALGADTWGATIAETALWHAGVLALATSYVCAIVLLSTRPDWNRTLGFLAPVGRMALTNYLGQSIACVFVFYGVGLGWYGRAGPTAVAGIAVAVFAAQAAASAWWLRRFQFGPAEWAWRSLTYGRRQPFRRRVAGMRD